MFNIDYTKTMDFFADHSGFMDVYKIVQVTSDSLLSIFYKYEYKPGWNYAEPSAPRFMEDIYGEGPEGIYVYYLTGNRLEEFLNADYSYNIPIRFTVNTSDLIAVGEDGIECVFSQVYLGKKEYAKARERFNTPLNRV